MDKLKEALRHIEVASIFVQEASTEQGDFSKSKPLNILYKELRASAYLLMCYAGDKQAGELIKQDLEIALPQSIKAFLNMNTVGGVELT